MLMIFLVMLTVISSSQAFRGYFHYQMCFFRHRVLFHKGHFWKKGQFEFGRAVGDTINISQETLRGQRDIGFVTAKTTAGDSGSIFNRSNFPSWPSLFKGTNSPSQRGILVLDFTISCSLIHFLTCKDSVMLLTAGFYLSVIVILN